MKRKGLKRATVIRYYMEAAKNSKLFQSLVLNFVVLMLSRYSQLLFLWLIPLSFVAYHFKLLVFESLVAQHSVLEFCGLFEWYNKVDDNLYLGAVPLEAHIDKFTKGIGIEAVLSIMEDYETNASTMSGLPISTKLWKHYGVDRLVLSSPDFHPPQLSTLLRGAEYINQHISNGKRVYCHCKSGKGRSASVVIAYLMKYKMMDLPSAYAQVKSCRSFAFSRQSSQYRNLEVNAVKIKQ